MASKGNTWFKKLITKQKAHTRKVKGVKKPFAIDGIKSEEYRAVPMCRAFGRQPRRFGSTPSPLV